MVTDFKTTNAAKPQNITPKANDPTAGGTKLQLPLYALVAVRDFGEGKEIPTQARYVYLRRTECFVGTLPNEAHEAFHDQLNALAATMASGDFRPGAPHALWGCTACSPDSLGLEIVGMRAAWWGDVAESDAE